MKTIIKGYRYEVQNLDDTTTTQTIQFFNKRAGEDGTTNEELLEVLIHRIKHLQVMHPCRENAIAIRKLEESLMWLEKRTADRAKRGVLGKHID